MRRWLLSEPLLLDEQTGVLSPVAIVTSGCGQCAVANTTACSRGNRIKPQELRIQHLIAESSATLASGYASEHLSAADWLAEDSQQAQFRLQVSAAGLLRCSLLVFLLPIVLLIAAAALGETFVTSSLPPEILALMVFGSIAGCLALLWFRRPMHQRLQRWMQRQLLVALRSETDA